MLTSPAESHLIVKPPIAFWPGLGGDATALFEIAPVLRDRGFRVFPLNPRYGQRADWSLDGLAKEMAGVAPNPIFMGHSWGAAIAAAAAALVPARALVLLDGAHISARDLAAFGANPDPEAALAEMRDEHNSSRWGGWDDYLAWVRPQLPRWNEQISEMVRSGMREHNGEIFPPFDADELEQIIRGYQTYQPAQTIASLPQDLPVFLLVSSEPAEHEEARQRFIERFRDTRPTATIKRVASDHDVVIALGPQLAGIVGDWLDEVLGYARKLGWAIVLTSHPERWRDKVRFRTVPAIPGSAPRCTAAAIRR